MVIYLPIRSINNDNSMDLDDASISSTLTVERVNQTKELQSEYFCQQPSSFKQKKTVHFDTSRNVVYEVNQVKVNSEECVQRWYNAVEYRDFKTIAQDASNQIMQIEARNRAPFSYQRVLEHAFTACLIANTDVNEVLPSSEFIHLQRWLEVATSRVGLEKWSIRKLSRDKSTRRRELAKTVMNLQSCMRSDTGVLQFDNDKVEFMRQSCENLSRPSRLFAMTLASALASAMESENGNDKESQ
jgi:hypothetical protein